MCFKRWNKIKREQDLSQRHPLLMAEVFEVQRASIEYEPRSSAVLSGHLLPRQMWHPSCEQRILLSSEQGFEVNCKIFLNSPCLLTCGQCHVCFVKQLWGVLVSSHKGRSPHRGELCDKWLWHCGLSFIPVCCTQGSNPHWHGKSVCRAYGTF